MKNSFKLLTSVLTLAIFMVFTSCQKEAIEVEQELTSSSISIDVDEAINTAQTRQFEEDCKEINFITGFGSTFLADRFHFNVRNNKSRGIHGTFSIQHEGDKMTGSISYTLDFISEVHILVGEVNKVNGQKVTPYGLSIAAGYYEGEEVFGWTTTNLLRGVGIDSGNIKLRTRDCSLEAN